VLSTLINKLASNEAPALGRLRDDVTDCVEIVTNDELDDTQNPAVIARTKDFLIWKEGEQGIALFDIDLKGMPEAARQRVKEKGIWATLCEVVPALKNVAHVVRASTSSGLRNTVTGETSAGSGGFHIYVPVLDVSDISRFLSNLHDRLWLAGFGWGIVSATGLVSSAR
jgi:hypothetical protein